MHGRMLLSLFLQAFKSRGELNRGTRMAMIHNIQYPGDEYMEDFYHNWVGLIEDVDADIPEATLRRLLYDKLQTSQELAIDLAHFDRLDETDPDFSHSWSLARMERAIQRKYDRKNEREYNEQIGFMFKAPIYDGSYDGAPATGSDDPKQSADEADYSNWWEYGEGAEWADEEWPVGDDEVEPEDEYEEEDDEPQQSRSTEELAKFCFYFAHGKCWFGGRCKFEHVDVTAEERSRMVPPPLGSSRTAAATSN